jgi:hypothetical protein
MYSPACRISCAVVKYVLRRFFYLSWGRKREGTCGLIHEGMCHSARASKHTITGDGVYDSKTQDLGITVARNPLEN